MNLLDGIVNTILGPNTDEMSEADRKKTEAMREKKGHEAEKYAFDASNGQGGTQFMRPETSVGLGANINDVLKMIFGGGSGGGAG
jgi:hypothetical protein